MSYAASPHGPVAIIPAMDIRRNRDLLQSGGGESEPINMAYYQPHQRGYSYTPPAPQQPPPEPYPPPQPAQQQYGYAASVAPSASSTLNRREMYGPRTYGHRSESTRRQILLLPQRRVDQPPPVVVDQQQYAYAPSLTPSDTPSNAWREKKIYQTRSISTRSLIADEKIPGPVKYFSGPRKLPEPLYHKRQYYRRTFNGNTVPAGYDTLSTIDGAGSVVSSPTLARRSLVAPGSRDPGITRDRGMERFPVDRGYIWTYSPTYRVEGPVTGPAVSVQQAPAYVANDGYYYERRRRKNDCSIM